MRGSLYEVRQLLKRFNIMVYTGNDADDAIIMELELKDLFEMGLIEEDEYKRALLILRSIK
jgi:uncharacterized protein YqgQ